MLKLVKMIIFFNQYLSFFVRIGLALGHYNPVYSVSYGIYKNSVLAHVHVVETGGSSEDVCGAGRYRSSSVHQGLRQSVQKLVSAASVAVGSQVLLCC